MRLRRTNISADANRIAGQQTRGPTFPQGHIVRHGALSQSCMGRFGISISINACWLGIGLFHLFCSLLGYFLLPFFGLSRCIWEVRHRREEEEEEREREVGVEERRNEKTVIFSLPCDILRPYFMCTCFWFFQRA